MNIRLRGHEELTDHQLWVNLDLMKTVWILITQVTTECMNIRLRGHEELIDRKLWVNFELMKTVWILITQVTTELNIRLRGHEEQAVLHKETKVSHSDRTRVRKVMHCYRKSQWACQTHNHCWSCEIMSHCWNDKWSVTVDRTRLARKNIHTCVTYLNFNHIIQISFVSRYHQIIVTVQLLGGCPLSRKRSETGRPIIGGCSPSKEWRRLGVLSSALFPTLCHIKSVLSYVTVTAWRCSPLGPQPSKRKTSCAIMSYEATVRSPLDVVPGIAGLAVPLWITCDTLCLRKFSNGSNPCIPTIVMSTILCEGKHRKIEGPYCCQRPALFPALCHIESVLSYVTVTAWCSPLEPLPSKRKNIVCPHVVWGYSESSPVVLSLRSLYECDAFVVFEKTLNESTQSVHTLVVAPTLREGKHQKNRGTMFLSTSHSTNPGPNPCNPLFDRPIGRSLWIPNK